MTPPDWRRKNAAWLHDPPAKHDAMFYRGRDGRRGHEAYAERLLDALSAEEEEAEADLGGDAADAASARRSDPAALVGEAEARSPEIRRVDRWAASADRPQLGGRRQVFVPWRKHALVTHPLTPAHLRLLPTDRLPFLPSRLLPAMQNALTGALDPLRGAVTPDELPERCFRWLWRRMTLHLAEHPPEGVEPLAWRNYLLLAPADTRSPDHSALDHVRLAAALVDEESADGPWLFALDLGPVQAWLRQTRTSRDLWVTAMLFAELSLAAMQPLIDAFGPDAVLNPDLRRNVRYDRELAAQPDGELLLSPAELGQRTRAALVPNHWLAVLPGSTPAEELRGLGRRCQEAALRRWTDLAAEVREGFFRDGPGAQLDAEARRAWSDTWKAQVERPGELAVHWAARRWEAAPTEVPEPRPAPAGPAQDRLREEWEQWRKDNAPRLARYGPLVGEAVVARYDLPAWVYRRVSPNGDQAGFDYALVHHALSVSLAGRGLARTVPHNPAPAGVVCTVCGERAALGGGEGHVEVQRGRAREAWARIAASFGWDGGGAERLCGVCATRRMIVPPWPSKEDPLAGEGALAQLHRVWAWEDDREAKDGGWRLRLPMPSTAAVAAGPWLRDLYTDGGPEAAALRRDLLTWARRNRWPTTFFPRSLPIVGGAPPAPGAEAEFTWLEPSMYYDGPRLAELTARAAAAGAATASAAALEADDRVAKTVIDTWIHAKVGRARPPSRVAVLAMDGDQLGKLLLGDAEVVKQRWRDVLHPDAVRRIEEAATHEESRAWAEPWLRLLDEARAMGPSLHAWLNRVLTGFANRVVPWVVEREYGGRLVYAGGDDVLALLPADHALPAAMRLQQLWSAAWVLDTEPERCAWDAPGEGGRLPRWDGPTAQRRLRPLEPGEDGVFELHNPRFAPHVGTGLRPDEGPDEPAPHGELLPMLGASQSLSAGIAYGHFKTPLQLLVAEARTALGEGAKGCAGRAACAEVLFTRGGAKHRSTFRWGRGLLHARDALALREAFKAGDLPGRLPYKLQDHGPALAGLDTDAQRLELTRGLVLQALERDREGSDAAEHAGALTRLWGEGLRARWESPDGLGNLTLCRALGAEEEE